MTGHSCAEKKEPFSKINISLLANFGCFFFGEKNGILAKNHFLAQRKNGSFSVVPAGTRPIVILGHFFDGPPTRFVDDGPKSRVLILLNWEWPEMVKKRGESRKLTHTSGMEFFSGWSEWKSCSTDMICPVDKNSDSKTKK